MIGDKDCAEIFRRLKRSNPKPKGELRHENPYQLLVAVALSAQATDSGVNKATEGLFREVRTPAQMLKMGEEELRRRISSIGLFRTKAKNVIAMARILIEQHGGEVPKNRDALEALPGVGRKTANVVLNIAFGEPTIAVDTHVFRVANRTGIAPGKDVRKVEDLLLERVPRRYLKDAHHWLILHGRYTCVARSPKCGECGIADLCDYRKSGPKAGELSPTASGCKGASKSKSKKDSRR